MAKKKTVQDRLQTASRKWGLTQVESIYVKESRAVYRAYCEKFHEVILKIHTNDVSLASECRALKDMRGRACCQVYGKRLVLGWIPFCPDIVHNS